MTRTTDEVHEELREAIAEYGATVNAHGCIATPGKFEGQPVEVLYFHRAWMLGDVGVFSDDECNVYVIDEWERDVLGLDCFAETFAVLQFGQDGAIGLEYTDADTIAEWEREEVTA